MKENGLSSPTTSFELYCDCGSIYLKWSSYVTCTHLPSGWKCAFFFFNRILALRKAEKEEEKRARERILQKLEEDKVDNLFIIKLNLILSYMLFLDFGSLTILLMYYSRRVVVKLTNSMSFILCLWSVPAEENFSRCMKKKKKIK